MIIENIKIESFDEVEKIFKDEIVRLMDIRNVDLNLSSEELKIELKAREKAVDLMLNFLGQKNLLNKKKEDININYSFK